MVLDALGAVKLRADFNEDVAGYESARASDIDDSEYQPDVSLEEMEEGRKTPDLSIVHQEIEKVTEYPHSDGEATPLRRTNSNRMPLSDTEWESSSKVIVQPRGGSRSLAVDAPTSPVSEGGQDKWSWSWGGLPHHQDPGSPTSPSSPGVTPFQPTSSPALINLNESFPSPAEVTVEIEKYEGWPTFELSMCGDAGHLAKMPPMEADELFQEHLISYDKFCENPSILSDPNLVVRMAGQYHSWHTAGPAMVGVLAFGRRLPDDVIASLAQKKSASSWRSWWSGRNNASSIDKSRNASPNATSPPSPGRFLHPEIQETIKYASSNASDSQTVNSRDASPTRPPTQNYAKTLRLTSDQLVCILHA